MNKFACVLALLLTGCGGIANRTVSVQGRLPILEEYPRPQLQKLEPTDLAAYQALPATAKGVLESNNNQLQLYSQKLESEIRIYNKTATAINEASRAALEGK